MVFGRASAGRGGGQIGRGGGQSAAKRSRGESSNGGGGRREKTKAEKVASKAACIRAFYRYVNNGMEPPPAYNRRESSRYLNALRGGSSSPRSSASSASTSRTPQPQPQMAFASDYVDNDEFGGVLAALAAEPTITLQDFVGEQYVDGMVELVQKATVGQEEKEAEIRQIAKDQPFVFLDSDKD